MKNIFKILLAIIIIGSGSCASNDSSVVFDLRDAGDSGSCNVNFCPAKGVGTACCITNKCGVDYGMGCVAKLSDAN
jgi:hypothetical protein